MRITANVVTMARIFLLPVPVYMLIYGEQLEWWIAFSLFVILGATDFVDGVMARREGPTKLGSLIDPVADKIFMAAIMLSMVSINVFPAWVASALLSREFLMTALRSSVAIRKEVFKTSMLAKLKTIIQMGGSGTIFFTIVLPETAYIYVCLALSVPFFLTAASYLLKRKRPPFWALPVGFAFVLVAVVEYFFSKQVCLMVQMSIILAITWASAIDYLIGSYRLFKRTGMFMGDWARIFWALVFGLLMCPLVTDYPAIVLPILAIVSLEFGLGGIDNIVVNEKGKFSPWPYYVSAFCGLLFYLGFTFFAHDPRLSFYLSLALVLVSLANCTVAFMRHIDLFKRSF